MLMEENDAGAIPYRHFIFDGWNVYIGKNDAQNDELTTAFAKPHDIWMHVSSQAGSHVIIRCEKKSCPPPKEVLTKAASLAAWFSKSRRAPFVKVHVTEKRFVEKLKNAPLGEVTVRKYSTIRISPVSPHEYCPEKYDT